MANDSTNFNRDTVSDALSLLINISSYQFIISLCVANECLLFVKNLATLLQSSSLDVVQSTEYINLSKKCIQSARENIDSFHEKVFKEAENLSELAGTEPKIPRRFGRQTQRNNVPAESPSKYYIRVLTIPFLDHMTQQMNNRFGENHDIILSLMQILPSSINATGVLPSSRKI